MPFFTGYLVMTIYEKNVASTCRPFGYQRVYLTLCKEAETSFHIKGSGVIPPPPLSLGFIHRQKRWSIYVTDLH